MTIYTVTITDTVAWTTRVEANTPEAAEEAAWDIFQMVGDRSEYFAEDNATTVKVSEVVS